MKKIIPIILSLLLLVSLCACKSKSSGITVAEGYAEKPKYTLDESVGEYNTVTADSMAQNDRKIIEYYSFTVETKNFDTLIENIASTIEKSGGYVEKSEVSGSKLNDYNRNAELKLRIPKNKQPEFSKYLEENSNVINKSVNADDVTKNYIDVQSRIKALTIEKETLEKLLAKSSNVSDTLTVYDKLTSVIAELESYQAQLNQMDNLIEYTTFTVTVFEVEKESLVQKQNWFTKTFDDLLDNLSDISEGLLSFASFIVSSLPYIVLIGAVAVAVILILRRKLRKINTKKNESQK